MQKWAVIGSGGFVAKRHIEAINKTGGKVVLRCDINLDDYPVEFFQWEEMLKSDEWEQVTHVAICTPNYLHCPMASCMKGKTVIVEKPLALSSADAKKLPKNVNTVLQLRYHPEIVKLKKELKGNYQGELIVKVKRDPWYWDCWKGRAGLSGGILFNLGIHYFDILIYLFGNKYSIISSKYSPKKATGVINFDGTLFKFHIEIMPDDKGQERTLIIDGREVVLSKKDNLSMEDLHLEVYKDVLSGGGIKPHEANKSIMLVEKLINPPKTYL